VLIGQSKGSVLVRTCYGKDLAPAKIRSQAKEKNSTQRPFLSYHASQKGNAMEQQCSHESVSILHELDLGQHILFLMSDGSIDLFANDEQTPYLSDNRLRLDSDETYRLFISLHEQFTQKEVCS